MRILVTGSRNWEDRLAVYRALNSVCEEFGLNYPPDEFGNTMPDPSRFTLVHGHCPKGADHWADEWAIGSFFTPERHPAAWGEHAHDCSNACKARDYCKRAGFRRNAEMVQKGATVCLAFIRDGSRGATMTADLAESWGIPVRRFRA